MFIRDEARMTLDLTWAQNLKLASKVAPSMRGVFSRDSRELFGKRGQICLKFLYFPKLCYYTYVTLTVSSVVYACQRIYAIVV